MNKLKKTLALVATLAISATAFVGCGDDDSSSNSTANSNSSSAAPADNGGDNSDSAAPADNGGENSDSAAPAGDDSQADAPAAESTLPEDPKAFTYSGSLGTGDGKMTVLCWTDADLNIMLPMWEADMGIDAGKVNFNCFGVGGGQASEKYDAYFLGGEDIDMFMVEADWALKYINDDSKTAALDQLGFVDADFANQYAYTQEIGRATSGANAGKLVGTSWQAAPGGWCYRTDLAETYLGVKSPEEMQDKVSDWGKFKDTAKAVSEASGGKTALTTTLGGIWQAYACQRSNPWVKDNALVVDDQCTEFIELAKYMKDGKYVMTVDQWADAWWAAGQTDDTMGYFVSTWGFGDSILLKAAGGEGGKTYGKWGVCRGPAKFYWGGTWACVSPKTNDADMVASFMNYFTINKTSMAAYAKKSQDYVNNKPAMLGIVDAGTHTNALLGGYDQYKVLHPAAQEIDLKGLITPYDAQIKEKFINAVNGYCNGETGSVDDCINAFKKDVAKDMTDLDVE